MEPNETAPAWQKLAGLPWHQTLRPRVDALRADLATVNPDSFASAVSREVRRRLDEFLTGITAYRRHPYRRDLIDPPAIWGEGSTRLRDYGGVDGAPVGGRPVLVVPSLVNRAYVLDLTARRSFLRFLAHQGFRPLLVDWDRPGAIERGFDLSDYIMRRLGAALDATIAAAGRKPIVLGYCMGGNLALGLAQTRHADIQALALLATPWDFHAERADLAHAVAHTMTPWMALIEQLGELPTDALQSLFLGLDPFLGVRKFRAFAALDPDSAKAHEFVALEDWLNDGVPLAAQVARECILGWYGDNTPARGEWRLDGRAVLPKKIATPSLAVIPEQDRIVPPASAEALAAALPRVERLRTPLGHIGMMVGSQAQDALWRPLAAWLDSAFGRGL